MQEYLPRSETFVHTLLSHQRAHRPVVLAKRLANLDEFPADTVLRLTPPDAPLPARLLRRLRARAARMPSAYDDELARAAQAHGCVALHAHFGPAGAGAVAASRRSGLPLLTTFYGYDLVAPRREPERYRTAYDELFGHGALFVCEGTAMAADLRSIGAPAERVRVVPIGIDLTRFPFTPRAPGSPLVLLQAARFVPKKGFETTIRAFAAALPRIGAAELRLVGDGPLRAELERLVDTLGVSSRVRFLGMLSYDEYARQLEDVHIGIQPSRTAPDGETEGGAPTVLLELQASGVPVVATRHADIPEVVPDPDGLPGEGDAEGVADAIAGWAEADAGEWRRRLDAARAHVERRHDARVTARSVEGLYREALDAGNPAAT